MAAKIIKLTAAALILGGLFLLVSGLWIPAKAVLAQHLLQSAWRNSSPGTIARPWPWADTWPVGRLRNGRLGVDHIVLEGDSGEVLAFGPGHIAASSPPGGHGHCILVGHRDTSFAFMAELSAGDLLTLEGHSNTRVYRVERIAVVEAEKLYLDGEQSGALTLITCYPFEAMMAGTPFRYVVFARSIAGGGGQGEAEQRTLYFSNAKNGVKYNSIDGSDRYDDRADSSPAEENHDRAAGRDKRVVDPLQLPRIACI
jgi:sortase A